MFKRIIKLLIDAFDNSTVLDGISRAVKESFQGDLVEKLKPYVRKAVCDMDLSSIAAKYMGGKVAEEYNIHGYNCCLDLYLPPLSLLVFKFIKVKDIKSIYFFN